jgi:hypothetical protein
MGVALVFGYLGLFKEPPDPVETVTAEKTKIATCRYLFSTFRAEHYKDLLFLFSSALKVINYYQCFFLKRVTEKNPGSRAE